jgi:hypothetical protein
MAQAKELTELYPANADGINMPAPIVASVSFETGEQGQYRIYNPGKIRIMRVRAIVTKALANTDAGTITVQDASGNTITTLTIPLSTALNTEFDSGVISIANQDLTADTHFRLLTAKTTAGGKAQVSIEYNALPSR